MKRLSSRMAIAAATVSLVLSASPTRVMAACAGTTTGELTSLGRGEAVNGTVNGSAHNVGFAGVIYATINGQPNVPAFCINLLNSISVGDCFNTGGPTSPQITWLLNHGYGPDDTVPGTTAQKNAENAARQAAVWYFSDSFITTDSHQARVQQIINAVPANPDPQADVPEMTIDPPSEVNVLPGNLTHTLTVSVSRGGQPIVGQAVNVSTTFGTLSAPTVTTDANGAASFTVTNGAGVAGTATVTATFGYLLPAGTTFEPVVSGKQKLVLATPTNATLVDTATKQWVNGGTIIGHKFLDSNADATQGPDEPNLSDWTMRLYSCNPVCNGTGCSLVTSSVTDANGDANFGSRVAGCYRVDEVFPAPVPGHQSWRNVTAASQLFSLATSQARQVAFGNIIDSVVVVQKFIDLNGNGAQDGNELFLDGWRMMLQRLVNGNWIPLKDEVTVGGQVVFSDLPVGHYRVQEETQSGWLNTAPGNPFELDLPADSILTVSFGNQPDCDDHNVCTDDSYDQGLQQCVHAPVTGTACDDGSACTRTDTCQSGTCVGGNAVTCAALDQCHAVGTCNASTGVCSNPAKSDGTPCDDSNACSSGEACHTGVCGVPASFVTCMPLDQCHAAGTCDPGSGVCSNPVRSDGTPCNDGNANTHGDQCTGGICTGVLECDDGNVCNGMETPDGHGGCLPGTPLHCDDGNACNGVETCNALTGCVAGTPMHCDDGLACNGTESCQGGVCVSGTPVDCSNAADQCNTAACVDPTGTCVRTPKFDGLGCDDGDVCTLSDSCQHGVCVGGARGGDSDGDGYCDIREMRAQCNPNDGREIPPQANAYSGGRLNTPGEILLSYASPGDRDVMPATNASCGRVGACDAATGVCKAGKVGDPCRLGTDCDQPPNTCRVLVNYGGTPDLQLLEVVLKIAHQPTQVLTENFKPATPGCSRKVDITLPTGFARASLGLKAQGTTSGRARKDRDRIKYVE